MADELRIALMLAVTAVMLLLLLSPHVTTSHQCRIAAGCGIFPLLRSCAQHVESGGCGGSRLKGHGGGPSRLVAVGRMAV